MYIRLKKFCRGPFQTVINTAKKSNDFENNKLR